MTLKLRNLLFFLHLFLVHIHSQVNGTVYQIISKPLSVHPAFDDNWNQLSEALKLPAIQKIYIKNAVITIEGLEKFFKQKLNRIKKLNFQQCTFNKETIKFVLNQNRIYQFQSLGFEQCNIFSEDFLDLQQRQTKIKNLTLSKNPISTVGFQYLSRLKMNLTTLLLRQTSLIDDEAVEAVISFGLAQITNLDLCATAISSDNLMRILKKMNLQKLKVLTICTNNFPLSFYEQFSNLNFSALEHLNIDDLNIDEDGFHSLMKMKFLSLSGINLSRNQLTSELGCQLFTKERFPNLNSISVDENFVNTTFLDCLNQQKFVFKRLSCQINKMNLDGLKYISRLDTSQLSQLTYSSRSTTPEIMKGFLLDTNFDSIEYLEIGEMQNAGDYFPYILQRKWSKLQKLLVRNLEQIDQKIWSVQQPIFPQLKVLEVEFDSSDQRKLIKFVKNIQKIAPRLSSLYIKSSFVYDLLTAIINGSIAHSLTIKMELALIYLFPTDGTFSVTLDPVEQCKAHQMPLATLFINYIFSKGAQILQSTSLEEIFENLSYYFEKLAQIQDFKNHLHRNFDYSELYSLMQDSMLNFISTLLRNNGNSYVFKYLKTITLGITDQTPLQIIKDCQFLGLRYLGFTSTDLEANFNISLEPLYNKFNYLQFISTDAVIQKSQFKSFFKHNNLSYLTDLNLLAIRNLRIEDISQIHSYIPYLSRVRSLYYNEAFINNDLTFIAQAGIQPYNLIFRNILFNQGVIKQLCDLNFEFLVQIKIEKAGVDDKSIGQLVQCIQNKKYYNKIRNIHFPKLKILSFASNYIGSEGTQKIMSMGMPLVEKIQLDNNVDSQIFNTIFRSPWSKRIQVFVQKQQKSGSIDPNLDPKNTRKLQVFSMIEASLQDQDIVTLSSLQFYSLETLQLGVKKIQNCQFLKSLLKLTRNTIGIRLKVNESPKLNSTCLKDTQTDMSWIEPSDLSLIGNYYYGEVSNFGIRLIGKTSEWKHLDLINTPIPEQSMQDIFNRADFSELETIHFQSCGIGDKFLGKLSLQHIDNVERINLQDNDITSQGLKHLMSKDYFNLRQLQLSQTDIGDKGIEYLIQRKLPKLRELYLANIGLTRKGLQLLGQLEAPRLSLLDLSNNGLTFDDLMLLNTRRWQLKQLAIFPSLPEKQVKDLEQQLQIHIETQVIKESLLSVDEVEYYDVPLKQEENQQTIQ